MGPLRALGLKEKFQIFAKAGTKEFLVKGASLRSIILTGRSRRTASGWTRNHWASGEQVRRNQAARPRHRNYFLGPERFGLLSSFGRSYETAPLSLK